MNIFKLLAEGTKVVLTSIKIKEGKTSHFKIGEKRSGTLTKDFEFGKTIYFKERKGPVTGIMLSSEICKKITILESDTSFYEVKIVKDENDPDFKENL